MYQVVTPFWSVIDDNKYCSEQESNSVINNLNHSSPLKVYKLIKSYKRYFYMIKWVINMI